MNIWHITLHEHLHMNIWHITQLLINICTYFAPCVIAHERLAHYTTAHDYIAHYTQAIRT